MRLVIFYRWARAQRYQGVLPLLLWTMEEEEGNFLLSITKKSDKNQRWTMTYFYRWARAQRYQGTSPLLLWTMTYFFTAGRAPNGIKEQRLFCCGQ
jgi:hypothetical protein